MSRHEFDCVVVGGRHSGQRGERVYPCITTTMIGEKCADLLREDDSRS
ncbi:hypothetical protein AB0D40_35265 [Streptomyces massasporeus]